MTTDQQPVQISPEAHRALATKMREWSGWTDATLRFGIPKVSPFAETDFVKRTFTANPEPLVLNPNRVLMTITPFRLRQEAVLTGSLLHESGHARHSRWLPNTAEQAQTNPALHSDGEVPTEQTVALARLMEEARIEGIIAAEADNIGATGLAWTMRAAAAKLLPPTVLSPDPNQAVMDVIKSWTLRAGRQYAYREGSQHRYRLPTWVSDFNKLLRLAIESVLDEREAQGAVLVEVSAANQAYKINNLLTEMCEVGTVADGALNDGNANVDTGPWMLDKAREILALLFPETQSDDEDTSSQAMVSSGCGEGDAESGDDGDQAGDEEGAEGSGDTEPEDPGEGDQGSEPGENDSESGDQDSDGDESQSEADSPGDDGSESEDDGATDSTDSLSDALAAALAQIEADSGEAESDSAEKSANEAPPMDQSAKGAGIGEGDGRGTWRMPSVEEREVQRGAEKFLREMIDTSESSKRTLTDQPSATVDGAAMAAWKAGGQRTAPRFFVRTQRIQQPSPPVQIAVLVDVSASMEDLQAPSALLSWALSSAAVNLRNFAGRGVQVQSCLIHWGSRSEVIAKNGEAMPGILTAPCNQGTSVMYQAFEQVEEQIPGFFDAPDVPTNRLLVQFTDWEMGNQDAATRYISRGLANGMNMLTVAPRSYGRYGSNVLSNILRDCPVKRGSTSLIQYHRMDPAQVWHQAAVDLAAGRARMEKNLTTTPTRMTVATEPVPEDIDTDADMFGF